MDNATLVIVTALFSGLIATFVTILWQKYSQKKQEKIHIFSILMSKRYDITSEESVEAMNMIDVVFYSAPKVRTAWKEFCEAVALPDSPAKGQTISDKHLRLLEVIAENIGYQKIKWEEIKHFYYPVGLSNRRQNEDVLRRVQIDAGIAQITSAQSNMGIPQDNMK